jgi:hypothetical protein
MQQQKQADAALTSNIQRDLRGRTRSRLRRYGFATQGAPGGSPGGSAGANLAGVLPPFPGVMGVIARGIYGK